MSHSLLSPWSQIATRRYVRYALAFALDDCDRDRAERHLRRSLDRVAAEHPIFAGSLCLPPPVDGVGAGIGGQADGVDCTGDGDGDGDNDDDGNYDGDGHSVGAVRMRVSIDKRPGCAIDFAVRDLSAGRSFGDTTFDELRDERFRPGRFVTNEMTVVPHETTDGAGRTWIPVVIVRGFFLRGGLLLAFWFHHSFGDGRCMYAFTECFAAATRGESTPLPIPTQLELDLPWCATTARTKTVTRTEEDKDEDEVEEERKLLASTAEYAPISAALGPGVSMMYDGGTKLDDISFVGKVFAISAERVERLRTVVMMTDSPVIGGMEGESSRDNGTATIVPQRDNALQRGGREQTGWNGNRNGNGNGQSLPSSYACLAAVVWSCVAHARLEADSSRRGSGGGDSNDGDSNDGSSDAGDKVSVASPIVTPPDAPRTTARLLLPVDWRGRIVTATHSASVANYFGNAVALALAAVSVEKLLAARRSDAALSALVRTIEAAVRRVDEDFVRTRTEALAAVRDPRRVGLNYDLRTPQDLAFNTWRHFGGQTRWKVLADVDDEDEGGSGSGSGSKDGGGQRGETNSKQSGGEDNSPESSVNSVNSVNRVKSIVGGNERWLARSDSEFGGVNKTPDKRADKDDDEAAASASSGHNRGEIRMPESIRRCQDKWGPYGALILPARGEDPRRTDHELILTMDEAAMELLCADDAWMRWVDRVIE